MARELSDILKELDASYAPQHQSIQQQIDALPAQADAQISGLQGQQDQAFKDILSGAQSRGLGFSGIPLGEQAQYTSSQFLPAVAKVREAQNQGRTSLTDALNNINLDQNKYAQGIRQSELDREEQIRQFNEKLAADKAAAANTFNPSYGGGSTPSQYGGGSATATQRGDKGFSFTDAYGNPISAAAYAKAKNLDFRNVLTMMANAGDQGAKTALGFTGNDFGYDPNKVNTQALANLYNSLVWGVGRQASVNNGLSVGPAKNNTTILVNGRPVQGNSLKVVPAR
jgi:hypothetical protein